MAYPTPRDPIAREQARRLRAQQVRRRRLVLLGSIVAVIALVVVLVATRSGPRPSTSTTAGPTPTTAARIYTANLTGDQQVPPVQTASTGKLTLRASADGTQLEFALEVDGLTNTSWARIYDGLPGETGQPVVTLYDGPVISGPFAGLVAQGTIKPADLTGSLAGKTISDLLELIDSGSAYVDIGNTSYPEGAIRGQIK